MSIADSSDASISPLPHDLQSRNPVRWLMIFGPGAIIASLTIGTGELIFSTRGGALFGYSVLFLFVLISLLKWGLVFASARHMVLTGVHPYRRMMELPGPRGWFPLMLLPIAALCLPIWISFHCGVTGNLLAWVTGTSNKLGGAVDYVWGACVLTAALVLAATCGYSIFERVQMSIVAVMMLCAAVTLVLYNPDWFEMLTGAVVPGKFEYPDWIKNASRPEHVAISRTPVWVEITRYVGVIGGAGFDYMAYTSWLRDKHWGRAALGPPTPRQLDAMARDPAHPVRRWIRAPLIDCSLSFAVIVGFSTMFIASGVLMLGPEGEVPTEKNFLNLQARLLTTIHPRLLPIYILGALLTMLGTVYGTVEIACAVGGELLRAIATDFASARATAIRRVIITWCSIGAYATLASLFSYAYTGGDDKPRLLLTILTPANLFTGVLSCGLFCLMILWMDRRFLPRPLQMSRGLVGLNLAAAVIFLTLGMRGYWDCSARWYSIATILGLAAASMFVALWWKSRGPADDHRIEPADSDAPCA